MKMKTLGAAFTALALGVGIVLGTALPASADIGAVGTIIPATAENNNPAWWANYGPHDGAQCYSSEGNTDHGTITDGGYTVTLNQFNQDWPGDHWELLAIKAGNNVNVIEHPVAGVAYASPQNPAGNQATVSHWIVCKGTTPPPPDVCTNIDGDQAVAPAGYQTDGVTCWVAPLECSAVTAWGTEADDTPPTLTPDGYLFQGGSGNAVGYGLGITGNLQGLPDIAYVATGDLDVFYPRIVINSLADGGYAYDSLTVISEGPVTGDSIAASNKRGFVQHTLDEWAELLPLNTLVAFFFHLDSGAAADKAVTLSSVTGGCFSANFAPAVPEDISGEDVEEQVNCETGEVDITTTPWTQEQVWDAESKSYQPGPKVYGDPIVTHRELTEGEYVECYGEQPEPESGSDKTEVCDESILVITTINWTQEYEAGQTGWVLGEKVYADPKVSRVAGDAACFFPPALALTGDATSAALVTGGLGLLGLGALAVVGAALLRRNPSVSLETGSSAPPAE